MTLKSVVQKLKNGKSVGSDNILNEYNKYTLDDMLAIYVLLFNVILDKGIIPKSWTEGIMIPIYKHKGSKLDPASYRGITLKTFTAVLNNRLNKFADEVELISGAQAGFRSGFSTVGNIFALHSLIAMYFTFGRQLFCSFVDFKSAFDTVWQKLQKSNIQGKMFKVIYNMYQNIKTCIRKGEECSVFFNSEVGVKQGENMSPFLFSLFLNDLETFFSENNISDLKQISKKCQDTIVCYLKIFIILYADDTVILSESAEGLQEEISAFQEYCNIWKLTVNTNKTKGVVYSKKKYKTNVVFKIYGQAIDLQDSYSYQGVIFNYNGNFCTAPKKLLDQAYKALYALYRKMRNLAIPIDLQLKLFDSLITPIFVWQVEC
jgi:hypothetical protein